MGSLHFRPRNCPRRPVFCMNRAAFLTYAGVVRIVRRSIQLSLAFLTSCAHIVLLISLKRVHSVSTCLTVSSPLLHPHLASFTSGTLRSWRNFRRPIFPVLIWTINELTHFGNLPCMCSTFLVGEGTILKSARPFISFYHSSSHFSKRSLLR